ncbi:MAG: acetyl-CoA carboxylase biotin carboxyl carrier protein subunit, partial [Pseudomonadota bacterium]
RIALGIGARRLAFTRLRPGALAQDAASDGVITAPMPGLVLDLLVAPGAHVAQGDTLAVLEAMKMQHPLTAPFNGTVSAVQVQTGSQVAAGDVLIILEED